jgi:PadR family transcriptional regulator, regulatory protein PadR
MVRGVHADRLRGHLDLLLLAVLAEEPGHGYELGRRLTRRSGGELEVYEGSLYPALHRLERGGLVDSAWSRVDGRRRRVYRLTAAGRRAITESRREWRAFAAAVERVVA